MSRSESVTPERLRAQVEAALGARARWVADAADRIPAAVLVLFVFRQGEPHLVFTKKTESVPHHKGQFAFPGGVVGTFDGSRVETALREAQEEIGLDPAEVEVVGLLDDHPTQSSSFVVTPVVGLARGAPRLVPDGWEVERVLEVPLRVLREPGRSREERWERDGVVRPVVFFTVGEDVIWGVTGRILRDFLDAVFPAGAE